MRSSSSNANGILPAKPDMPGSLNTPPEKMLENIRVNIARQLPQVKVYPANGETAILAFSGPSLRTNLKSLKRLTPRCPLVTVNGSHNWLIGEGCVPSAHIMLDARPSNAAFVAEPVETCRYLIASQCAPEVFEALEGYDVHIFHCDLGAGEAELLKRHYLGKNFHVVMGGSTVGLRSLMLLRMLGFKKYEIFGFDSCFMGSRHHAFPQGLNDGDRKAVELEGMNRKFFCSPWMLRQAYEFQELARHAGHLFQCKIHGNGLIANMVRAGAQLKET